MQNIRLDEAQTGIKIARRNINKLIYADDTTLMAKSKKLKNLKIFLKFIHYVEGYPLQYSWASLVAQLVKNLPAMWET